MEVCRRAGVVMRLSAEQFLLILFTHMRKEMYGPCGQWINWLRLNTYFILSCCPLVITNVLCMGNVDRKSFLIFHPKKCCKRFSEDVALSYWHAGGP